MFKKELERPKDRLARIIFIPLVGFIASVFFDKPGNNLSGTYFIINIFISIFATLVLWEGNRWMVILLRNKFPSYRQVSKRISWQLLLCTGFSLLASNSIFYALTHLFPEMPFCNDDRLYMSQISLLITLLIIAIYESSYFLSKWKQALFKTEELKRENIISQFETLKSQVNPHFLFNSLNTLTVLIEENPTTAVRFVNQLSQVYRYVIQSKEKELTDLKTELDFTASYLFLLQNRFEKNLQIDSAIPANFHGKKIAPLCLQMLIENAIKHNVVSSDRPLKIEIYLEGEDYIAVKNNLQLKHFSEENNGIGLPNIINRYSLLTEKEVKIVVTDTEFKVSLPLL